MSSFIAAEFIPVEAHIKERSAWFHRFDVSWTPTVLIMDSSGIERYRIEGYLPKPEFRAELMLGLARVAFKSKNWADAERKYGEVVEGHPDTLVAPEAQYWTGVSQYQRTHDHEILTQTAQVLQQKFPRNLWTVKASVWLP